VIWILLVTVLLLVGLCTVAVVSSVRYRRRAEAARTAFEVRRAEMRLHQIARDAFQTMLDETRQHQQSS
jgi:uncharacterized membrane protein